MTSPRAQEVLAQLAAYTADDLPTHGGTTTAYVFDPGDPAVDEIALRAYELLAHVNGLDPTQFPSVARIENDLVATVAGQLGGDEHTVGTITSGGTESCLLAVLGARERWRATAPGGSSGVPQLVVATTVHAAFYKAAHLFGLDVIKVAVDPLTLRADPAAMAAAISPATALVVVSAPSYAYGVIDPVREIAAAAAEADVPCHVDACIGGWVLPFLDGVHEFDLSVRGVTSISVDLHKYGYVPKGVSVLLHKDAELRLRHWFTIAGWAGYPMVNPTLASSRPVGPMASAWAVQRYLGIDGFRALARTAHDAADQLAAGIAGIDGLHVVGGVDSTLVAFADDGGSDDPDVRVIVDEVARRGWHLQIQPEMGHVPTTAHATITASAAGKIPDLLAAIRESVVAARKVGRVTADPDLIAAAAQINVDELTEEQVGFLLEMAGVGAGSGGEDAGLPERMAPVHALVEALPSPLAERLLAGVLSRQLTPER